MSDIQFTCSCGKTYKLSSAAIGKQVRCPNCKKVILLQGGANPAPPRSATPIGQLAQQSNTPVPIARPIPPLPVHTPSSFDTPATNPTGSLYGDYASYTAPSRRSSQAGFPVVPIILTVAGVIGLFIVGVVVFTISQLDDPFKNFRISDSSIASPSNSDDTKQSSSRENPPLSNYTPAPSKVVVEPTKAPVDLTESRGEPIAPPPSRIPIDDATMISLGERLAAAMQHNDPIGIQQTFDDEALFRRAIDVGFKVDSRIEQGNLEAMRNALRSHGGPLAELSRDVQRGGAAKFIRLKQMGPYRCAIVRVIFSTRGVNYLGMIAEPTSSGSARFCDAYSLMADDMFSDPLRRGYIHHLASQGSMLDKLTGQTKASIQRYQANDRLLKLLNRPAELVRTFETMDNELKSDKKNCMLYLRASIQIDEATYQRAMEHYQRVIPPGNSSEVLLLDLYLNNNLYDRALASLAELDAAVGGDAYIDVLRSSVYALKGNNAKAAQYMKSALAKEPEMSSYFVSP